MATGIYFLLCQVGKRGGFGPYVGFDVSSGFELTKADGEPGHT